MDPRRGRRGRGLSIKWYLTALVLVPLIGLGVFAVGEVTSRLDHARQVREVERLIRTAEDVGKARSGVQEEVMPALARTFLSAPDLFTGMDTAGLSMETIGLSRTKIGALRAATDRALRKLTTIPATAADGRLAISRLRTARALVDAPTTLIRGFSAMARTVSVLDHSESAQLSRAQSLGLGRNSARRLADADLVATLAQTQDLGVQDLAAAQFAFPQNRVTSWQTLVTDWGRAKAAADNLAKRGSRAVVAAVARASSQTTASVLDGALNDYITNRKPVPLLQLGLLYRISQTRSAAMYDVLVQVTGGVVAAATAEHQAAQRTAWWIAGAFVLAMLLSIAVAGAVRRALGRPLQDLSERATKVSQGELVPVLVRGPAEVRTVARGLSAAVDNLRNVEALAAAVAAGDLESDIVRQPLPGELGAVMHRSVTAVIDAIHERDAAQRDLAHRATHDALTELPNRTQAMAFLRRSLHRARRTGAMTAVMFVDLDHFKHVNDNLGHNAGDAVLQASAQRMAGQVRAGDSVFRLGGDEFVVLLEDVANEIDTVHLAERLIDAISRPIPLDDSTASVGASIGIAFSRDGAVDAERLLSEADAAAYRAKQSGRGRVGIFDDDLRVALAERAALESALLQAIRNDELVLHYQPIVRLDSGRVNGVEALMRWNRPGHGLVPPNEFIPAAETSALINDLGRWALHEATAQLARWDAEGRVDGDFTVAVNISGRHLLSHHLVDDVGQALDEAGIEPHRLTVELTETVLVDDPVATRNLHRLRELGVHIAIDDFGTGYTSIGQLPKLPIDELKIDRSFIAADDRTSRDLVPLIVAAAHAFGITVVAEGIERSDQADSLDGIGVDNGQGFYFARPQPASNPELLSPRTPAPA